MFKSQEEREAARREKEGLDAQERLMREEKDRAEAAASAQTQFAASPVGRATAAKQAGETFFEIQLDVGSQVGSVSMGGSTRGQRQVGSSDHVLGEIEKVGWHLEHTGYYFMLTGETSTAQFLGRGRTPRSRVRRSGCTCSATPAPTVVEEVALRSSGDLLSLGPRLSRPRPL